jgi:AAA+ ATPase superfamily predicted ATPase
VDQKILINPEALSLSYLPEKLLHRDKERSQLISNIRNSINTFLCGDNGSGKTALVKHALGGLEVARGRSLVKEVEALFEKLASSEELKKLFEEYSKAGGELHANKAEIEGELKIMASKVRDGEPLRGARA